MIRVCLALFALGLATTAAPADPLEDTLAAVAKLNGEAAVDDKLEESAPVAVTLPTATDAQLLILAKHVKIGSITIEDATRCTDRGYAALKGLPNLQKLVLSKSYMTERSAYAVGALKPLKTLYLGESRLTDTGVAGLKKLPELRSLDLYNTPITDRALAHLIGLEKLEDLNLSGTRVTDKGVLQLKPLKSLKQLRLVQTNVTRAGVTKLEEALPSVTVRW